ncbi:MAG: hypothetical protein A2Z91_07415 [Deltaproteobacteria bacterium GWA2_38_16]|nr:MAG: hypothetical protein A2Z91_07415 [Deltaproteobacteria bacterium GWA2_38_16]OGQ02735.1 MAG: hypothetical protein A3D19_00750 [Deltaproteobacteria bacterium RIFCSPHIGHO2_02_FULL_38_15]OGQ31867.1 MAG: hypothetical protein A3A72_02320 [Deltaproteobacteria bacterium RIFCSPLOWO2_01_FULL_38_9]HBQ20595.1 DUF4160 domain-containing protein [Deltaproteobacteria bacterium]
MSPTVVIIDGARFFFFSNEGNEKPHVHVQKGSHLCKFWLAPKVRLAHNSGFKLHELRKIEAIVLENREIFLRRWYEFFKT